MATSGTGCLDNPVSIPTIDVRKVLRKFGLHPDKRLGQNFLTDPKALEKVVAAAEISSHETILEVGPGLGNLTCYLATFAKNIVAVELDPKLIPPLQMTLKAYKNVTIVQGDILKLDPTELIKTSDYAVVANIPYYITSNLIRHLLEAKNRPTRLVLTVQLEVANRICAKPGDMSLLSLSIQVYGKPRLITRIPATAFYPTPKVDSAVVCIDLYSNPIIPLASIQTFFQLIKAGFGQKRKTLRNSLAGGLGWEVADTERWLIQCEIDPRSRAETLSIEEWERIVKGYRTFLHN
jgi:16S rRNA (adenine1518-N6/adenine1519-N6)-dimethyltransferase